METIKSIFAIVGLAYSLYFIIGLFIDITSFDQTKGGYKAPFEGWIGTPVDWNSLDQTTTGLVKRGHIMDVHIHGTTGMMTFEVFNLKFDWQKPSQRALKVHKPKEALQRRGFNPEF